MKCNSRMKFQKPSNCNFEKQFFVMQILPKTRMITRGPWSAPGVKVKQPPRRRHGRRFHRTSLFRAGTQACAKPGPGLLWKGSRAAQPWLLPCNSSTHLRLQERAFRPVQPRPLCSQHEQPCFLESQAHSRLCSARCV